MWVIKTDQLRNAKLETYSEELAVRTKKPKQTILEDLRVGSWIGLRLRPESIYYPICHLYLDHVRIGSKRLLLSAVTSKQLKKWREFLHTKWYIHLDRDRSIQSLQNTIDIFDIRTKQAELLGIKILVVNMLKSIIKQVSIYGLMSNFMASDIANCNAYFSDSRAMHQALVSEIYDVIEWKKEWTYDVYYKLIRDSIRRNWIDDFEIQSSLGTYLDRVIVEVPSLDTGNKIETCE